MKIISDERPDIFTDKIYVYLTYLAEPDKGDTEQSICEYIEAKHGLIEREVVLENGCWGRKILIIKRREKI